jgi:hypothetical protein
MPSSGNPSTRVHSRRSASRRVHRGPPASRPVAVLSCCTTRCPSHELSTAYRSAESCPGSALSALSSCSDFTHLPKGVLFPAAHDNAWRCIVSHDRLTGVRTRRLAWLYTTAEQELTHMPRCVRAHVTEGWRCLRLTSSLALWVEDRFLPDRPSGRRTVQPVGRDGFLLQVAGSARCPPRLASRARRQAVIPKVVKKASRAMHPIDNAVYSAQRSVAVGTARK